MLKVANNKRSQLCLGKPDSILIYFYCLVKKTRTKTSIRYAKENDRQKTERRRERVRKVEGEIREGGREEREREG